VGTDSHSQNSLKTLRVAHVQHTYEHKYIVLLLSKAIANIIVINSSILLEHSLLSFSLEISCGALQFLNLFYL